MKSERVVTSDHLCECYLLIFRIEWNFQTGHVYHFMTLFKEGTFCFKKDVGIRIVLKIGFKL